jgi:metallophosphoesterase superfamily enzyme
MTAAPIHFREDRLMLDPTGAAFWPARRLLMVADLHLEKSTAAALRGNLLPPFDTRATLEKLTRVIRLYRPAKVIALGDTFHDRTGSDRLTDPNKTDLPGEHAAEWREAGFTFRHQAEDQLGPREVEISGHYHPKASIDTKAKRVSRPCFVTDSSRLMLPAFGAYTGGLDVRDPAIAKFFPRGLRVFLLGQDQLFSFALGQLGRMAEVA